MKEPRITDQAQTDLDEAWDYLSQRNIQTADRILDRILTQARLHAKFPLMGRPRDDLVSGLRSFSIPPYVVFYRPAHGTIEVLRVLYGSRDVDAIMRSP